MLLYLLVMNRISLEQFRSEFKIEIDFEETNNIKSEIHWKSDYCEEKNVHQTYFFNTGIILRNMRLVRLKLSSPYLHFYFISGRFTRVSFVICNANNFLQLLCFRLKRIKSFRQLKDTA